MKQIGFVVLALLVAIGTPGLAQSNCDNGGCDPYDEDPGEGCIWGPDDPFCDPDGGGSCKYQNCSSCYTCKYVPEGPSGEPEFYFCMSDIDDGRHIYCTAYSDGCSMDVWCKIA